MASAMFHLAIKCLDKSLYIWQCKVNPAGKDHCQRQCIAIIHAMHLPRHITRLQHAGHDALQLTTHHGTTIVALHGAHLLSWQVSAIHASSDDEISLSLAPCTQAAHDAGLVALAPGLQVSLRITLGKTLSQTLHTRNLSPQPFPLTQALHSYFAVSNARQVGIEGLTGLPYQDRLRDLATDIQQGPFAMDQACDRTYHHASQDAPPQLTHRYILTDPAWQRRIVIDTQGSQSVVVWNPGSETARTMADVPDDGWQDFFCIEAANAGPDVIVLAPGAEHRLAQTSSITL